MSSSTSFSTISAYFGIYAGLPICIFGLLGNLINIRILFSTQSNSSSSLLLFVSSIFNIIALAEGLLPKILVIGFSIDASSTSIIWCKSRYFFTYSACIGSFTCLCFASIDRFFVSCRSLTWRKRSKLSTTKIAIFIATLMIIGSNVPFLFFFTIIQTKSSTGNTTRKCSLTNSVAFIYVSYVLRPVLLSLLPGIIMSITGWLTYRNITAITNNQLRDTFQRSLTSMILLQIIVVIIPIIPFAMMCIYRLLTSSIIKSSYRLAQEAVAFDISNIILFISYASNFYVYLISTSSYRKDFLQLILFSSNQNHIEHMTRKSFQLNTASKTKQVLYTSQKTMGSLTVH